jgi:hypothetical protein
MDPHKIPGLDANLGYLDLENEDLESRSRKRDHIIPYNHEPPIPTHHTTPPTPHILHPISNEIREALR